MRLLSSLLHFAVRQTHAPTSIIPLRCAMTSSPYYRDRFYAVSALVNLPRDVKFKDDRTLAIDYATYAEVTSSLAEITRSASERGDNVGTDEFVGANASSLTEYSFIFTARPKVVRSQSNIVCFIIIRPSKFARTLDPCLADIHVIRTRDVTDSTYFELVELSTELTRELDVGYTDCILSVSASCEHLIDALTSRHQFTVAATLPKSVHMANGIGLVDSKLLVRNIAPPGYIREPRSLNEVLSMLAKHDLVDGPEDDAKYADTTPPSVPFLPQPYRFHKANLAATIRNMHKDEDRVLFDIMNSSRTRGEGIALNDRPNLAYFRNVMLAKGWCIVFEDDSTGRLFGFLYICQSLLTRSEQSKSAQALLVLDKDYQNRGLGREIAILMHAMSKQLGFTNVVNFFFANNVRSHLTLRGASGEFVDVGVVPRSAFVVGAGWQDLVLRCNDLSSHVFFFDYIQQQRRQPSSSIRCDTGTIRSPL